MTPSEIVRHFVMRARALKEMKRSAIEMQDRKLGRARVDRYYEALEQLVADLAQTKTALGDTHDIKS